MEILNLFGIDLKLMLAQLVNFAIVVFVLWRFAIKPLSKTMAERNKEISQGLDDAKAATDRLEEVEAEVKTKLQATKEEAAKILDAARLNAEKSKASSIDKTKGEVEALITKAKQQIAIAKTDMVDDIRVEVTDMIVQSLTKILSEKVSKDIDKDYIAKILKHSNEK